MEFPHLTKLDSLAISQIYPARELRLLSLISRHLIPLELKKTQVIETPVIDYPKTRAHALEQLARYPDIDGLYWTSRQDDTQACMLFEDRVSEANFRIALDSDPLQKPPHLKNLVDLVKELGIGKGHSFPSSIIRF